jgi:predicted transcriptional regulator
VLDAVTSGTEKPTRIMYEAGLSWNIMNEILSSLVSQGFVEKVDVLKRGGRRSRRVYRITRKGESLVRYYRNAEQLLKVDEPPTKMLNI